MSEQVGPRVQCQDVEPRDGWFVRGAARVGDLGSPFYAEERQRDVWNEASAIGFQVLLWLLPSAGVLSVWAGGATAVPYGLVMFLAPGLASWVVILYARARGVDAGAAEGVQLLRWRTVAWVALGVALCAGVVRAQSGGGSTGGFTGGAAWGAVAGAVLGAAAVAWSQHRARRARAGSVGAGSVSAGGRSS